MRRVRDYVSHPVAYEKGGRQSYAKTDCEVGGNAKGGEKKQIEISQVPLASIESKKNNKYLRNWEIPSTLKPSSNVIKEGRGREKKETTHLGGSCRIVRVHEVRGRGRETFYLKSTD